MRGIPADKLQSAMTVIGVSGKIDSNTAYVASGGFIGAGACVGAALSTRFRVISKNYLEKKSSTLYLENSDVVDSQIVKSGIPNGVTIAVEPDIAPDKFFNCGTEFMETGYLDLIQLLKQVNIFHPEFNYQFYLYERGLPEEYWKAPIDRAIEIIDDFILHKPKNVEYATDQVPDKAAFLFELWKTNSAVVFQDVYHKDPRSEKDRLGFDIKIFFTKKSATGNPQLYISLNNIALIDKTENSITRSIVRVLRNRISESIGDEKLRKFTKNEYRFPTLLLAAGISYKNAEFTGATKTTFNDTVFEKQMTAELSVQLSMLDDDYWNKLAEILLPDIEAKYAQFYDTPRKKSDDRQVFTKLNYPRNYFECRSTDPTRCELYIVEGTSAGNIIQTRDPDYQAVYLTRGKPTNAATMLAAIGDNRKKLKKDPLYQDLCQIININEHTTDMNSLRFNRVVIATDADPDGLHIRCIHLNNFYIINSLFIESGRLWLANPPLYSMRITKNRHLFLRDRTALMDARVKFLYQPTLDIQIDGKAGLVKLTDEAYRDMCYVVMHLGERFEQVSKQLNIPLLILERLVYVAEYLYPVVKMEEIAQAFASSDPSGFIRVQTDAQQRSIVVSVGREDYVVGLDSVGDTIVHHLLPLVKKFRYRDYLYLVRSKHAGGISKFTPMSAMMLYQAMQQLNGMFEIFRYKGLGQMKPQDCYNTLMNPSTRSLTHVTSVGDIQANFDLLGTDSTKRKELLSDSQVLTASFVRQTF